MVTVQPEEVRGRRCCFGGGIGEESMAIGSIFFFLVETTPLFGPKFQHKREKSIGRYISFNASANDWSSISGRLIGRLRHTDRYEGERPDPDPDYAARYNEAKQSLGRLGQVGRVPIARLLCCLLSITSSAQTRLSAWWKGQEGI